MWFLLTCPNRFAVRAREDRFFDCISRVFLAAITQACSRRNDVDRRGFTGCDVKDSTFACISSNLYRVQLEFSTEFQPFETSQIQLKSTRLIYFMLGIHCVVQRYNHPNLRPAVLQNSWEFERTFRLVSTCLKRKQTCS